MIYMAVRDDLYTRLNIQDINYCGCRITRYEVGDQLFIQPKGSLAYQL